MFFLAGVVYPHLYQQKGTTIKKTITMKTTLQELVRKALIAGAVIVSAGTAYAQCTTTTTITGQNGATINYTNQSSPGSFSTSSVYISFGDGTADAPGLNSSGSHTYTSNGTYYIDASIYAYDPADTTNYCEATDRDTIVITGLCNIQTQLWVNDLGNNTVSINGSESGNATTAYYIVDYQDYIYQDSAHYTFSTSGPHTVCYYVSDSTATGSCFDSTCTTITIDSVSTCSLQPNVSGYDMGNNTASIYGYANSSYTSSYITVEGQIFWGADSLTYTFGAPGTYQICYYVENADSLGYCYDSICSSVTVTGSVNPAQDSCYAYFYIYEDSMSAGTYYAVSYASTANPNTSTYLWDFGDGTTSNQQYPYHNYSTPGVYTICLTVYDGVDSCSASYCDSTAGSKISSSAMMSSLTVIASTTGVKDNTTQVTKTAVYPNPMADASIIVFESATAMNGKVEVVNLLGAVVYSENTNINRGANEVKLSTSSLVPGMYYVNIIGNGQLLGTIKAVK